MNRPTTILAELLMDIVAAGTMLAVITVAAFIIMGFAY